MFNFWWLSFIILSCCAWGCISIHKIEECWTWLTAFFKELLKTHPQNEQQTIVHLSFVSTTSVLTETGGKRANVSNLHGWGSSLADKPYGNELFLLKALILRIFKCRETLVQFVSQYIRITFAHAFVHGAYIYCEWFLVELGYINRLLWTHCDGYLESRDFLFHLGSGRGLLP